MKSLQTSKEFKREYRDLLNNNKSLDAHINIRLKELTNEYPNAVIFSTGNINHTAEALIGKMSLKGLEFIHIECKLQYIEAIEAYRDSKARYIQGKLFN